jgi:hypothetical protein
MAQFDWTSLSYFDSLKMEAVCFPETLVSTYKHIWRCCPGANTDICIAVKTSKPANDSSVSGSIYLGLYLHN